MKNDFMILASGVDTLHVSYEVHWKNDELFQYLDDIKRASKESEKDEHGALISSSGEWKFQIKSHGSGGYAYLLTGRDFFLKIMDIPKPTTRPNVFLEIRSEALWEHGYEKMLDLVKAIIAEAGGSIRNVKPSRADLCTDILIPEDLWSAALFDYRVSRARDFGVYYSHSHFTGAVIGKGIVSGRLYDKPLEIKQKSQKIWMYDIWGLSEVPEGYKIIRVEFQLRREVLKQLGCDTIEDFQENLSDLWGYCTRQWLKFQDNPGKHHTQRKNLPFWNIVQEGFQVEKELVRVDRFKKDKDRLFSQLVGFGSSLNACLQSEGIKIDSEIIFYEVVKHIRRKEENNEFDFADDVRRKLPKYSSVI